MKKESMLRMKREKEQCWNYFKRPLSFWQSEYKSWKINSRRTAVIAGSRHPVMGLISLHGGVCESGGQTGHVGYKVERVTKPDHIKTYMVEECAYCQNSLKRQKVERIEKRQVFDLPQIQMEVTEPQAPVKRCAGCGKETRAEFPKEVNQAVQYGIAAKSQMSSTFP
jgi:hypothetical protein